MRWDRLGAGGLGRIQGQLGQKAGPGRRSRDKAQLASDRTSCRSPLANQMRLILHTAAYWLMLAVRDAVPKAHAMSKAQFATLRLRVVKIGARIRESAHRVRIAFAAACPDATLFRHLAI